MRLMSTDVAAVATLVFPVWMFMSAPFPSEARAEAEADILRLVVGSFLDRDGVVYADRPERRYPLNAEAGRDAHQVAGEDLTGVLSGGSPQPPQRTDIDKRLANQAEFLWQAQWE